MNELTDRDESGLGWVYPPQPQTVITVIEEVAGIISGTTELIQDQDYIDVVFGAAQPTADWVMIESSIFNITDGTPINVWPGVVTSKTTTGFRLQLNGTPDSGNYFLNWSIRGVFGYYLSGPVSGLKSVASSPFTVRLPDESTLSGTVIITPTDGGVGGTFTPSTVALTVAAPSATFTYTPSTYGVRTIRTTNNRGLVNPAEIGFTVTAPTYTLTGPSSGDTGVPSSNFTVELIGTFVGTLTVTPDDGGDGGTFTPTSVALTTGAPSDTFTYTPATDGAKTISTTNDGGLANPASLIYTASAPFDPSTIAGLKLWLKADALGLNDGDLITTWTDSSTNGYDLSNGGGSARPTFKTNIINGKPVVRFDGVANTVSNGGALVLQPNTLIVVGEGGVNTVFINGQAAQQLLGLANTTGHFFIYTGGGTALEDTADSSGAFHIFSAKVNAASSELFIDGNTLTPTGTAGSNALSGLYLMSDGSTTFYAGDIAEILVYDTQLSPGDRISVEDYLKAKYGIV